MGSVCMSKVDEDGRLEINMYGDLVQFATVNLGMGVVSLLKQDDEDTPYDRSIDINTQ